MLRLAAATAPAIVAVIGLPEALMLVVGAVLFAVLAAFAARRRGRRVALWGMLGCLLGPVALLVVVVLPTRRRNVSER